MLRLWPLVTLLRSRKSRRDQIVAHLSAVATARREEVGWGADCQARVVDGVESSARGVSVRSEVEAMLAGFRQGLVVWRQPLCQGLSRLVMPVLSFRCGL